MTKQKGKSLTGMTSREKIIAKYIEGYNEFSIEKMIADFDDSIGFENISNGETTMSLSGIAAFKEQAEQAKVYFSTRRQTVRLFKHHDNQTEIEIDYYAILAMDFPNGMKKGDELKLQGQSIFEFKGNKIIKLTDIS